MGQMKYSLAMIARNCASELEKCLLSFAQYPDDIVVVNTGIDESEEGFHETTHAAEKFGARVVHFPWVDDFSKARNVSFAEAEHNIVLWLDSDDVVRNAKEFDKNIRAYFAHRDEHTSLLVEYVYETNAKNQVTTRLLRERVVDRRVFEWRAPIHEALNAKFLWDTTILDPQGGFIEHQPKKEDQVRYREHLQRNLRILESYLEKHDNVRCRYYIANTLMGLKRFPEAVEAYERYVQMSNNPQEIYAALVACAEALRAQREFKRSVEMAGRAITIDPRLPTAWLQAAESYMLANRSDQALHFAEGCIERFDNFRYEMANNPSSLQFRPHYIRAVSLASSGKIVDAKEAVEACWEAYHDDSGMRNIHQQIQQREESQKKLTAFSILANDVMQNKGPEQVTKLAVEFGNDFLQHGEILRWVPKTQRPKDKRSIAIFAGANGFHQWGPDSIEKGIGGSEEAVIRISKHLADLGWHVEVYCSREQGLFIDDHGVHWYSAQEWRGELDDALDVVIFWRLGAGALGYGCHSRLMFSWAHDVPDSENWKYGSWDYHDGYILLSKFHREVHPFLPDDRIFMSANGIDSDEYPAIEDLEFNPRKLIYSSCPARGLDTILSYWPQLIERFPDLTFDVFYGRTTVAKMQMNSRLTQATFDQTGDYYEKLMRRIDKGLQQPGVTMHGMVGQSKLHDFYAKSGFWVYPTQFPEISCITAMKAQALGAWPVASSRGALSETILDPSQRVAGDMKTEEGRQAWFEELVRRLENPPSIDEVRAMARKAREAFSWRKVAEQWTDHFSTLLEAGAEPRKFRRKVWDPTLLRPSWTSKSTASETSPPPESPKVPSTAGT